MAAYISRRALLRQSAVVAAGSVLATKGIAAAGVDKPKIKIGQIGTEHAHATKLEVYRRSADYEVVGVVEPNPDLRRRASALPVYRDVTWMTQDQLLNVPDLQVVLVETHVRELL